MTPAQSQLDQVRRTVLEMPMAQTLGLGFRSLEPGRVEIELPLQAGWCFRPGQLQATAIFAAADFAAVAAAATVLPPGFINSTVDVTLKLLAPAMGSHLIARGHVVKASGLLTVCGADVFAVRDGEETHCASCLATARNLDLRKAA